MAETWSLTGSNYIISGTNGSITAADGYCQNGSWLGPGSYGTPMGYNRGSTYGSLALRITVKPTVNTRSITFSFTHADNTNGYIAAAGTFYVKASTTASWPGYNSTDGTSFTLSSAGTKSLTVTFSSTIAANSTVYIYLWASYDTTYTYTDRYVNLSKLSALTVTEYVEPVTGPPIKYYDGSWKTASALKYYNGSSWVTVSAVKYYNGSSWVDADG